MARVVGPSHTILAVGIEFLAVGLFTLLAGASDEAGKIVIILMIGFWLIYAVTNSTVIAGLGRGLNKVANQSAN